MVHPVSAFLTTARSAFFAMASWQTRQLQSERACADKTAGPGWHKRDTREGGSGNNGEQEATPLTGVYMHQSSTVLRGRGGMKT